MEREAHYIFTVCMHAGLTGRVLYGSIFDSKNFFFFLYLIKMLSLLSVYWYEQRSNRQTDRQTANV